MNKNYEEISFIIVSKLFMADAIFLTFLTSNFLERELHSFRLLDAINIL